MIVVDASVVIEMLLRTPGSEGLAERLLAPSALLNAPHLLDIEVTLVLRRYVRQRELTPTRADEALQDLADLPVERWSHTLLLPRIWSYRDNLSAYDATYLALADALDCGVLTRDSRFAGAPPCSGRVELA
ncbi:type II toxin-antitoxin system VapC family toxin [Thiorhodococcus mannitoliphagus]|uniref:Ribonuclease VapC n=1 Tax=Thiorhodococcus mannitoliphagus TaxID=329406 RepID=A0A6P1DXH1_9GAMM|nr:type II toxin-antitoxin system VapC family toxin [Thiorhodococcus mannitoliphagus]